LAVAVLQITATATLVLLIAQHFSLLVEELVTHLQAGQAAVVQVDQQAQVILLLLRLHKETVADFALIQVRTWPVAEAVEQERLAEMLRMAEGMLALVEMVQVLFQRGEQQLPLVKTFQAPTTMQVAEEEQVQLQKKYKELVGLAVVVRQWKVLLVQQEPQTQAVAVVQGFQAIMLRCKLAVQVVAV
jgi:hypothetical protein